MKKNIIYGFVAITILMVMVIFSPQNEQEAPSSKKYKTPKELKEEVVKFKTERRITGWAKPDKPSQFLEYHKRIRTKDGQQQAVYPFNYKLNELNKAQKNRKTFLKSTSTDLDWIERGPGNVSGRTRGLIIDPDDLTGNTWFAGSVGGGIWKTSNAGMSWVNLTPNFPTLSTVTLAMAASNTQVIYAGTGEGFGNSDAITGDGIFKSKNKGESWEQLPSTTKNIDFRFVNRLIVDPYEENIVIAATNTSIQKSIDGGENWTKVFYANQKIQHIISDPNNFNILYASVHQKGVIKSTDKGINWRYVLNNTTGRIELAISTKNSKVIYALNEISELFVSSDAGENWSPSEITSGTKDKFLSGQGWYDNTLAVDPNDENTIIIGGVNLYKVEVSKTSGTVVSAYRVDSLKTAGFLDFINFGGTYFGGGIDLNESNTNFNKIEIQFGAGKTQKAHRFKVPTGATSGVTAKNYTYTGYVDVPFEVWNTGNNRQLMVSFRDQDNNGVFNLTHHDDDALIGREYIWINDVNYSTTAAPQIAKNGGQEFNEIAYMWPVLAKNANWEPLNLPESKIIINRSETNTKKLASKKIADWAGSGAPYVHADLHNIQYFKTNKGITRIVVANDGGLGYSDDNGKTWKNPSNGYNTTQFYGIDKHPTKNRYIGGMQDNGSWFSLENPDNLSNWNEASGGDGFDAVWHATQPEKMITSIYYNDLYYTPDGGTTWIVWSGELTDRGSTRASFVTQIGYTPNNPNKLYLVGKSGVTYSENFGINWKLVELPIDTWNWSGDGFVEPSLVNADIVWAISRMNENSFPHISINGGKTFNATNTYHEPMGIPSGFATHPTDPQTAYALFSFSNSAKILRTNNLGQSWEDISGFDGEESNNGFPDVAVYSLLVMPHNTNIIWAGTEIGLFVSNNNGESWEYANNGLPSVSIWEMKIRGSQVVIGTHGRGIWSADIPEFNNAPSAPTLVAAGISPSNTINIKTIAHSNYDSLAIFVNKINIHTIYNIEKKQSAQIFSVQNFLNEGKFDVQLLAYKDSLVFKSGEIPLLIFELNNASNTYTNSFEDSRNDFTGEGFNTLLYSSLNSGKAIHTKHPYADKNDIATYLKTPIIINGEAKKNNTILKYRDIPMVEEGETGSKYGGVDFYDYVVVEGSKNGIDWLPLADGYDFRKIQEKANLLGIGINQSPTSALFLQHEVNLYKTFAQNDTILIRFRLYSDQLSNGWGWVIDDIDIYIKETLDANEIGLEQAKIYPVPCDQFLNIELPQNLVKTTTHLRVIDLNGKLIKQVAVNQNERITLNTSQLKPSVYILEIRGKRKKEIRRFQVQR